MKSPLLKFSVLSGLFFLLLAALLPGAAHAQRTTAGIEGTVTDQAGQTLPGANVVAVHQPTGTRYGASTDADGRYNLQGMRVGGPYTVTASFVGYQAARETGINLQLDQTRTISFALAEATQELEAVRVIGERDVIVNENRTGASTNISQEEIERLPTIDRSLADFARLTPQSGGGTSLAGRNNRYNNIQIDGATLNDVFGLSGTGAPGGPAGAQPISLDAIKEFNVDIAPYDVRSSGFTGGQINAITKSGTNEFSGSLRFLGRNEQLVGELSGLEPQDDFGEYYYVGTLGGPIIENKLFFFLSGELVREGIPRDAQVGTDLDLENAFREDPETFNTIREIAQNQYGYDPGSFDPLTQRTDNEKFLAKLDWNINDSHRLTLRHNYVNAIDGSGLSRGSGSFGFSNSEYLFHSVQNSTTAQLNSTLGPNMYNEARLVYTRVRDQRDIDSAPFPSVAINLDGGARSIGLGEDRYSQANRLDQDLFEITNNFTYQTGDHTLTFGTNNQIFSFANLFIRDAFGTYVFEQFERGDETISAIEAFRLGQPTEYNVSYATDAVDTNRPQAEFTAYQLGFYVQDEWEALENLKLTGGLRLDVPVLPQEPLFNPTAFEAFGRSTTTVASGNQLWSPRVGFNYSLGETFATQFRGGTGLFSGPPPFVWISNQYTSTGVDIGRVDATFSPGEDFGPDDRFFSPDPNDQPRPGAGNALQPIETTEVNLLSDDFQYPQTLRTNLAVDQELPLGLVATLEGIYSSSINDVAYRNINIEQEGTSLYGRPLYGSGFSGGNATTNRVNEQFTDALLLENTSQGYEYSLTAQIQRRQAQGLSGSLSYTFSQAQVLNDGASSQALSQWRYNPSVDINDLDLATSSYEVPHRLLANLTYRFDWGDLFESGDRFATSFGVVYDGRSGNPFSYIYFGDANGDGTNNDLPYVPENERDVFLTSDNWNLLDAFIRGNEALQDARGEFIDRNAARDPWVNILDLSLTQEIATFEGQDIALTANLENVLNFLDEDWGRIRFSGFNEQYAWDFNRYVTEGDVGSNLAGRLVTQDDVGKPVISASEEFLLEPALSDEAFDTAFESRWRLQFGVRYTF